MSDIIWDPLRDELARWAKAGRAARFWLRDDDAIEPTSALTQLLDSSGSHAIPLTLAVIAKHAGKALADSLQNQALASVAVHGWSHENHAGESEKKQELGGQRRPEIVAEQLRGGYLRLETLFPDRFVPVLVPPWNRIDPPLLPRLPQLGFAALSVFGAAKAAQQSWLPVINTHVDLMDWHGSRGCRPHGELVAEIVAELRQRFDKGDDALGILTHHLVHDASAWDFLHRLFEITAAAPGSRWVSIRDLY
ncbi:MAG: polysaccharide deacetylase family protein [Phyllobacterium sp.]